MERIQEALSALDISGTCAFVSLDTEGTARSGGLREIAAVNLADHDCFFVDTVTPIGLATSTSLASSDAARTWAHVGPRFWKWAAEQGDVVVFVGHNIRAHDRPLLLRETAAHCPDEAEHFSKFFFVDTLDVIRKAIPIDELRDRRQESVYTFLFGGAPPRKHAALADARANAAIASHPRLKALVRDEGMRAKWSGSAKKRV